MKKMTAIALGISLALGVSSCSNNTAPKKEVNAAQTGAALGSGIDLASMDTSVAPQQDFFRYVNGKWVDNTQIPGDKARWGSFDALGENAENDVRALIKELAASEQIKGSEEQKIADLYKSFLDEALAEQLGLTPLKTNLAQIDKLKTHADLAVLWGEWQPFGIGTPLELYIDQDEKQSDQYITGAYQSGLGLPDREYYLKSDAHSVELLGKYQAYIAKVWALAGMDKAEQVAANIVALEKKIATAHWTRIQNRDRTATYNKLTLAELDKLAPGFNWQAFLAAAQLGNIDAVVINQPTYATAFAKLQAEVPVARWQQYLKFHSIQLP